MQNHNLPVVGLEPATTYYFRVASTDAGGNGPTRSATFTFTTDSLPDTKKPVVTRPPEVVYKTDSTATVYWETDEPADTVVDYGPGSTRNLRSSDGEKNNKHQATLANLSPGSSYSLSISSTDMSGNTVVAKAGKPITFLASTDPADDGGLGITALTGFVTNTVPDTTAPVITVAPAVVSVTDRQAAISWTTDEIADSQVRYGVQGLAMVQTAGHIAQATSHLVVLTNLSPSTTYSYQVSSTDPSANGPTLSAILTFTTNGTADVTGPAYSVTPAASGITTGSAAIGWSTDEPATTGIRYGTSADSLTSQAATTGLSLSHSLTLNGLAAATTYYFRAISIDSTGNQSTSGLGQFTTSSTPSPPVPPTITGTSPANGATGVSIGSSMTVSFSKAMAPSTITNATFTLNAGGGAVNGEISYSGLTATLKPTTALTHSTTYTAAIAAGATDTTGTAMSSGYSWTFTTAAGTNGSCGSAHGLTLSAKPVFNLCADGSTPAVSGSGPWTWTCSGTNGGNSADCLADPADGPANGACGSANGTTGSSVPVNNLCADHSTPLVYGSGPWTWSCPGSNGGTNAICSAKIVARSHDGVVDSSGRTRPDITDAVRILRITSGIIPATEADLAHGDVAPLAASGQPQGDGRLDVYDVIGILRMAVGLI